MPADETVTSSLTRQLTAALEADNRRVRIIAAAHMQDLASIITRTHADGQFDETFFQEELTYFRFSFPEELSNPQSLIVIATPHPPTPVIFHYRGREYSLLVPPTYAGYNTIPLELERLMTPILSPAGYRLARARIPFKRTVVSSGLGRYGRNNLCYIEGMGSFFELEAFYSDLPCEVDHWQDPKILDRCSTCSACLKLCPTKAIAPDRFLLHAERCLTFHNERPGEIPFPEWINKSAHNALIGCMTCQVVCPENVVVKKWKTAPIEFSELETNLILKGGGPEALGAVVMTKLTHIGLSASWKLLPRNLGAFLS